MVKNLILLGSFLAIASADFALRDSYGLPLASEKFIQTKYGVPEFKVPIPLAAPLSQIYGLPSATFNPFFSLLHSQYSHPEAVVVEKPAAVYGLPLAEKPVVVEKPAEVYGPPAVVYGPPKVIKNEFFQLPKPTTVYGAPQKPIEVFAVPQKPAEVYGPPLKPVVVEKPAAVYGVPVPQKPHEVYGPPKFLAPAPAFFQVPAQVYGLPNIRK